jgi:hypothetical protein
MAVFALLVCAPALFLLNRQHPPSAPTGQAGEAFVAAASTSALTTTTSSDQGQPPPGSSQYQNSTYHFFLYYPDDLSVTEQPGADGSMVVLFEDPSSGRGFDIFMAPYDQPKITQATFLMDEPSGVMNDPQNITIDGAPATEFFSTNAAIGASREIWFLHGGFLYEATAPQPLDSWLLQIMETWQFT